MTLDHMRLRTLVLKPALALSLLLVMVSALLVSACGSTDPVDTDPTAAPPPTETVGPDPTAAPTPAEAVGPDSTAAPPPTEAVGPDPTAAPTPTEAVDPTTGLLVPTSTPQTTGSIVIDQGITSLEERIFYSDVIAVVKPISVLGKWMTIPSDEGVAPTYLPYVEMRFKAIEYLKGAGGTEIIVEDPAAGLTSPSEEIVKEVVEWLLEMQNRAWDDTEAVVFLKQGLGALGPSESRYRFTLSHLVTGTYRKYSVDSDNKAWLPRDDSSPGKQVFLTDSEPGADGKLPVITLWELRDSIKAMDVLLRDGEGIDGYEECLVHKFAAERYLRAWEDKNGPFTPPTIDVQIASGLPAGSEFRPKRVVNSIVGEYDRHWITGPDEDLFLVEISDPSVNYLFYTTARPLPGGPIRSTSTNNGMLRYRVITNVTLPLGESAWSRRGARSTRPSSTPWRWMGPLGPPRATE